MMYREILEIETQPGMSYYDITSKIAEIIKNSQIPEGMVHIFTPSTTAGLMVSANSPMLLADFKKMFKTIDEQTFYNHPSNAWAHLRASLLRRDKSIPVANNNLLLREDHKVFLWEFDSRKRLREVFVTIVY